MNIIQLVTSMGMQRKKLSPQKESNPWYSVLRTTGQDFFSPLLMKCLRNIWRNLFPGLNSFSTVTYMYMYMYIDLLWFDFILGSIFIFLCFIHKNKRKIKIEPP